MKPSKNGFYLVYFILGHNQIPPPGLQRLAWKSPQPPHSSSVAASPCIPGASLLFQCLDLIILILVLGPGRGFLCGQTLRGCVVRAQTPLPWRLTSGLVLVADSTKIISGGAGVALLNY